MGCVVTWVSCVRGLHGSKYFLRGSAFYAGHNFYMGCVGQVYFFVGQFFFQGSTFLRGSIFGRRI